MTIPVPTPLLGIDLLGEAELPEPAVRLPAQQGFGGNGSYTPDEAFGQKEGSVVAAFRRRVVPNQSGSPPHPQAP